MHYTVFNYDVMRSMFRYIFDASKLGEYHDLNKEKGKPRGVFLVRFSSSFVPAAREAMLIENSPVVIDNTNTSAWEMKPYVDIVSTHPFLKSTYLHNYTSFLSCAAATSVSSVDGFSIFSIFSSLSP